MSGSSLTRRQFLGRATGAVAATALGGSLTAGCAASVDSGGSGKKRLTVMEDTGPMLEEIIKGFEKEHPDIGVAVQKYDWTKLTAMFAQGSPPDLVRGLGAFDPPYIALRDLAEDLDPYFADSDKLPVSDLDPVNDLWKFDGTTQGAGPRYGITHDYSQDATLWYNTALFEEAGVEVPDDTKVLTYEELLDLARRLTQRSGGKTKVYGYGGYVDLTLNQLLQQTLSAGVSIFNEDFSKVDFSSPEARKVLQYWLDLGGAQVSFTPLNPNPEGWAGPTYLAGRVAILQQGYWYQGQLAEKPDLRAASVLAPAPQMFGQERISPCYAATGFWIPKEAGEKEAAWSFLEYYMTCTPFTENLENGWGISGLASQRDLMPQDTPHFTQTYEAQQRELPYFSVISLSPYVKSDALAVVTKGLYKNALSDGWTVGALADRLTTKVNDVLADGKAKVE